jgi:hypothetical protein
MALKWECSNYVLALIGVRTLCPNTSNLWH